MFPFRRIFFLFAPDAPGGGASAPTAGAQPAAPSPSGVSSSPGASAAGGGGGTPPSSAPAAAPSSPSPSPSSGVASVGQPTPAPADRGVLDYLREMGLTDFAGQYQNDHAALQALASAYQQLRQAQPLLPYAQQFAQHAGPFQQWLAEQQRTAQQPQKPKNPFGLPEFDQRLLQMVKRNEQTGQLEALQGAPYDAVQRVTDYAFKLREAQDQFWQDPSKFLGPMIEEYVNRNGQQLVQQGLGGYQDQLAANQFVQQHSDWLHAKDQGGNPIRDPMSGQPMLSPWGQRFASYAKQAEQQGLRGMGALLGYAFRMVQADALQAQYQAGAAQQAGQQANAQFVQQPGVTPPGAARTPSPGGSVQPPSPNGTIPAQNPSETLRERMSRRFKENGFQVPAIV